MNLLTKPENRFLSDQVANSIKEFKHGCEKISLLRYINQDFDKFSKRMPKLNRKNENVSNFEET